MKTEFYYIIVLLSAYLVGSLHPAYFFTKKIRNEDIRNHGSNNSGASNATMVLGWKFGILTAAIDILKGFISVFAAKFILPGDSLVLYTALLGVILGHLFPFYLGFKGGKGLASLIGGIFGVNILTGFIFAAILIASAFIIGYISIGTIVVVLLFAAYTAYLYKFSLITAIAVLIAALMIFKHIINIKRIRAGEEKTVMDLVNKKKEHA